VKCPSQLRIGWWSPRHRLSGAGRRGGTTAIARELHEIPKEARLYHLDRYDKGVHSTLGFFEEQPSYEVVRKAVVDALEGRSSKPAGQRKPR
jgi:hypothetical protein